ncbi:MAG: hypothetical protein Q8O22_08325, partial [Candidatus Omnitrophota bacterium]|nr:hypothetical protein [Candidatus Omnitrophota bacterium]
IPDAHERFEGDGEEVELEMAQRGNHRPQDGLADSPVARIGSKRGLDGQQEIAGIKKKIDRTRTKMGALKMKAPRIRGVEAGGLEPPTR